MKTSPTGILLIKSFEQCRLTAYLDTGGVPTIGWGITTYENGKQVTLGDTISQKLADDLLHFHVLVKESELKNLIQDCPINQHQFDAFIDFTYNLGTSRLARSTLFIKFKKNPFDPSIRTEFMKWVKGEVKGKLVTLANLVERRAAEADLYFTHDRNNIA